MIRTRACPVWLETHGGIPEVDRALLRSDVAKDPPTPRQSASRDRSAAFRRRCLVLAKTCLIRFRSGLNGCQQWPSSRPSCRSLDPSRSAAVDRRRARGAGATTPEAGLATRPRPAAIHDPFLIGRHCENVEVPPRSAQTRPPIESRAQRLTELPPALHSPVFRRHP